MKQLQPIIAKLPEGYRIEEAGSIEEAGNDFIGNAQNRPAYRG